MAFGHVTRDLSALCEGVLEERRRREVEEHLRSCERCRRAYEETCRGVEACREISQVSAPESLWDESFVRTHPARARDWGVAFARAAVLAAAVAAAFAVWFVGLRSPLELRTAAGAPSAFEEAAREAHASRVTGKLEFDYRTDSPEALRAWLERAGFGINLALRRPPEDNGRFQVVGAKIVQASGARAALVGYQIDSRPVTLLAAPLREVANPPYEGRFMKRVALRADAQHGVKLLSWGSDGQAYVLVSDLPGHGTEACSICHTSPERRELIRNARLKDTHGQFGSRKPGSGGRAGR